ncbi:hypothetical protein [Mycetocola saprophilus]|uniref:hypothetical protein n=1 Tax=Mycetocola saprophilus TaxID=76636 RepID=UPI0004C15D7A|nr:hypothetical protein [Mycetocola saprophilus]
MPKSFPKEFLHDVIPVEPRGEAPISRIAENFGVWNAIAGKAIESYLYVSSCHLTIRRIDHAEELLRAWLVDGKSFVPPCGVEASIAAIIRD